jgi:hypothetical protein
MPAVAVLMPAVAALRPGRHGSGGVGTAAERPATTPGSPAGPSPVPRVCPTRGRDASCVMQICTLLPRAGKREIVGF